MEPSNDRELAIARVVDRIALAGKIHTSVIVNVITALDFTMSKSECKFLVNYVNWRMDNPIAK
jgi:hypothetical protein